MSNWNVANPNAINKMFVTNAGICTKLSSIIRYAIFHAAADTPRTNLRPYNNNKGTIRKDI